MPITNTFDNAHGLKDFFHRELKSSLAEAKADLLIKIFGIVAGCVTMGVTALKLFP